MVEVPSILIVDDDEGIRQSLDLVLKKKGYQLVTAETGVAALAFAQDRSFNIALVDVRLPDMEGTDLVARLKVRYPDLEVILITGYASLESSIQAVAEGAYRYLTKPLDMDEVVTIVRAALEKQRLLMENKMLYQAAKRELSERRRAEEALRESKERFRIVAESTNDLIYDWDILSGRLEWLGNIDELLGYAHGEFPRTMEAWEKILHPEDYDRVMASVEHHLRTHEPFAEEYRVRRKDGTFLCWMDRGTARWDDKGNHYKWVGAITDITSRKQAEEDLQQSEARYRAVVEQSADGIYLVDVETKHILEANLAFAQMLGYTAEEIWGLSVHDIVAAEQEVIDQRFQERVNGKGPSSYERQYRKKDGSLVEVWVSFSAISYGGRKVMCALVRDLTEKKALDAQFLRAQRMESIGLLAGGIAHDLNNILAPILMNAELLQGSLPDSPHQKLLSSIASSAQRGADIVKQILTFARGMEGEFLAVSPRYLLKETERFLRETFPKTITLEVEIPPDLWPLSGDATQMHQVLMNLCLNAKDAMEKGGTMTLSAQNLTLDEAYAKMYPEAKVGSYLVFSVEDTGCGIPPAHREKIFDPFFTTKQRGQGTGLGLSTVYSIVKGHGGFLAVDSEVGKGTAFRIYLPASPAAEGAPAVAERQPLPLGSGELILVAEDEESIRDILKTTLETYGYSVLSASDGAEAVSLYAQRGKEISLVVTDMAMPIMDGMTTIRALQKIDPAVKIIATSGLDAERMVAEASGLAVKAFLQKPFTAEQLLRILAEVLKGK